MARSSCPYLRGEVVVTATANGQRHWLSTAYSARKLTEGEVEWARS